MEIDKLFMKKLFLFLSLFLFLLSISKAQQQGIGITVDKTPFWFEDSIGTFSKNENPITQFPTFCGKKLRNNGNTLPFPFGVGVQATFLEQNYTASNLQLYSENSPVTAHSDTVYQNTVSSFYQVVVKPDIWLMSFLNVYGIFGYTKGKTSPDLLIPYIVIDIPGFDPIIIDTTFQLQDELSYYGPTYGAGASISAGFKHFFFALDYNYSITKPNDVYDKIYSQSFSPKAGIFLGRRKSFLNGMLWAGSSFLSNNHNFTGTLSVQEIAPGLEPVFGETAQYSGTISAVNQWNFLLGASIVLGNHHYLSAEAGFIGRKQLMLMYDFRF